MRKSKSQAGYTLIEIMMVVGIAGILAMMGGVAFSTSTDRYNFENERAKLFQALSRARTTALTRQECLRVLIGSDNTILTHAFAPVGADRTCTPPYTTPELTLSPTTFHDNTVLGTFSEGGNTLVFNATGGLDTDNVVTFLLSDKKGNSATFRIFPAIGQIRMN